MKQIRCKIISQNGTKEGAMLNRPTITFEELINWVYRVCEGAIKIEIDKINSEVLAFYEERCEIYTITDRVKVIGDFYG